MKTTNFINDESQLVEINTELQKLLGESETEDFLRGVVQGLEVLKNLGIDPNQD